MLLYDVYVSVWDEILGIDSSIHVVLVGTVWGLVMTSDLAQGCYF
jgi:hypothetical protein